MAPNAARNSNPPGRELRRSPEKGGPRGGEEDEQATMVGVPFLTWCACGPTSRMLLATERGGAVATDPGQDQDRSRRDDSSRLPERC